MEPGIGAGAFIEYESGGQYRVTTSCDVTDAEAQDCLWDIVVTPLDDAPVLGVAPLELEPDDTIAIAQGNSVRLLAYTGAELDGFTLSIEPGAAIHFDALLDNGCANRYLFWVGDGALRSGAPSNVIDLVPSTD